jgi:hypothetical protein
MSARGRLVQEALSHGRGDASIVDMNENGNVIPRSNPFDSRRT